MKRKCQRCNREYPVYGPFVLAPKFTCLPCLKDTAPKGTSLAERTAQVVASLSPREREILEQRFDAGTVLDALNPGRKL